MPADADKKIVVLNVSSTVLYDHSNINTLLLDTLKENKISDVYLFTDLSMDDIAFYGRDDAPLSMDALMARLSAKGIQIKSVVTPADFNLPAPYGCVPGSAYYELYQPLMDKRKTSKQPLDTTEYTEETLEFLFAKLAYDRSALYFSETCKNKETSVNPPGLCLVNKQTGEVGKFIDELDEAIEFFNIETNRTTYRLEQRIDRSIDYAIIPDEVSLSTSIHGCMLSALLAQLQLSPQDAIYYFSDDKEHIEGVDMVAWRLDSKAHTCQMNTDWEKASHPKEKENYQHCLEGHSIQQPQESAYFLLRLLSQPMTWPVFLLAVGAFGLGLGMFGVSVGLSVLASQIITAASASVLTLGAAVGVYRFFKYGKEENDPRQNVKVIETNLQKTNA